MTYYFTPYSTTKNLGAEYNKYMALLQDGDTAVVTDGDTCFLTPDYGMLIDAYVTKYPDAVLTCWTNRINEKAEQQYPQHRDEPDMRVHMEVAATLVDAPVHDVTALHGFVSGFLMVIPKKVWSLVGGFAEQQVYEGRGPHNLLGCDNDFTNRVRGAGVTILRMNRLYIWHTYRLLTNSNKHLL